MTNDDTTAIEKIQAARYLLVEKAPYLSRVIWNVQFVKSPGMMCPPACDTLDGENGCQVHGTIGVDKHLRLYYDPGISAKWDVPDLVSVLAHETNHVLRMHCHRVPIGGGLVWNIATDCEINDDIVNEFPMPGKPMTEWTPGQEGYLVPATFGLQNYLTAEEYFAKLSKYNFQQIQIEGSVVDCGSVVDDKARPYELDPSDKNAPGVSELEKDLIRKQVAKDLKEHIKTVGNDPMGLEKWADEILDSKVDWRKEIYAKIRSSITRARGSTDYSYRNPNFRRNTSGKFILPGLYEPVPSIVVIVDTSGSISQVELAQAIAEINGIFKKCNAAEGVTVISCDSAVQTVKKVYSARQLTKLTGGGGTDMGVGIAEAEKLKAQVIVVITDGYTPWPEDPPRGSVIVGILGNIDEHTQGKIPEWARVVIINDFS